MSTESPPEYDIVDALERSAAEGSSRALDELLCLYERILGAATGTRDAEPSEWTLIFNPLGRLIGDPSLRTRICGWLRPLSPRLSIAQRVAFRTSFLDWRVGLRRRAGSHNQTLLVCETDARPADSAISLPLGLRGRTLRRCQRHGRSAATRRQEARHHGP